MGLFAQSGTLNGTVIDASTNEPVPFANVSIEENGNVVTGGMTDFDGRFSIKPIKAGKYDVSASYIGYGTVKYSNVQITAGQITFQNFKLKPEAEMLAEVEVIEYKVPLIQKDQTQSGGTMTSEDISRMSARSADAVAATVGGVYSEDGSVGSIRGSRSEDVVYYVDGVKVRGSSSVPKSAIEQVSVITGGVPAQYGDATGGIISLTTKGPASEFWGGAEVLCSVEGYGYNLAGLTLSGPIWTKTDAETNRKRTIMGFMVSAEGMYVLDGSPSAVGEWRAYDDVKEEMTNNPLRLVESENGAVVYQNTLYLKDDSFYNKRRRSDATNMNLNIAAKIDIAPIRDLDITFGTNIYLANARMYSRSNSLFNSENNGRQKYGSYRMYGRLTQKFRSNEEEDSEKKAFLRNPYYTIQVDYTMVRSQSGDVNHWDNYFDYGYVGKFDISPNKYYSWAEDTVTGLVGNCMETFFYQVDEFNAGSLNPGLANYTNQFYDYMGSSFPVMYTQYIQMYGGLLNGNGPSSIYGMWQVPGVPYGSYSKSDATQLRVSANAAADLGGHEISLGFEFEQRRDSYFGVSAFGLWGLARSLTNSHIEEIDKTNPIVYRDDNGMFLDTID
ncbi:MAG: carboxypeptidase-like regulatory domain-containing protein, partial [Bacteroidales bacterium]|nr:carboxypeptidase-like regulatory domain-containing protein [Bacteroidales bacterium]